MKKRVYIAAVLSAVLAMTSCGENAVEQTATDVTAAAEAPAESVTTESAAPESEAAETEAALEQVSAEPSVTLSATSGFYAEEFELALETLEEGEIFYTTDGSSPIGNENALSYTAPLKISDRSGDENVVSAVPPIDISANFNKVTADKKGFETELSAPEKDAVDKCTVIRAAVKKADGSFGGEACGTYFIGSAEEHINGLADSCAAAGGSLAVVSLNVDYDDFFGSEEGIYVKGSVFDKALEKFLLVDKLKDAETARSLDANYKQRGKEWERTAEMTLLEVSPDSTEEVLNQPCGVRIQGNYSRSDLQKGLRLYARKDYGNKNFSYPVFGEDYKSDDGKTMDKFSTLVLRAGGNCAFTAKFNDAYWQSLVTESACDTMKSRPCVVYLNGEYWGLYVLQEDYTDDFFEDRHGVDKDSVIVYKGDAEAYKRGYSIDEGEIPQGESEDYYFRELNSFFRTHSDLKSEEDYNEFVKLVDPNSVMDYFAVECWINNKWDWPGKNWSMWKATSAKGTSEYADGRWRLVFYDVEFGGVSGEQDAPTNTIKEDNYKKNGLLDMDTNNPAVLSFAYLMTNDGFREKFCERLSGLSAGEFEQGTLLERLQYFQDVYSPLYGQFFLRYPGAGTAEEAVDGNYASIKCIRDFVSLRQDYIQKQLDYCEKILG